MAGTNKLVGRIYQILLQVEALKDKADDIQNRVLRYSLTGRENELPEFTKEAASIDSIINSLKVLTEENPGQQLRIDTLKELVDSFLVSRVELSKIRRNNGADAAQKQILKINGNLMIGEVTALSSEFIQKENQILAQRKEDMQLNIQNASEIINIFRITAFILLLAALFVIYDNTRRRNKAEGQMREYQYFFNNNNDLCGIANTKGYFEKINANFINTLGYSEKEFCATPFIDLIHPDDVVKTLDIYGELKSGALVINFVNRYRKKDGSYLYLDWNATPNAETGKLYCVARDITRRIQAQEKLLQMANRLSLATRSGGVGIWDWNIVNNKMEWDEQMYRLYGITPETFGGAYEASKQGRHPEDVERVNKEIQQALRGEKEFNTEFRVMSPIPLSIISGQLAMLNVMPVAMLCG